MNSTWVCRRCGHDEKDHEHIEYRGDKPRWCQVDDCDCRRFVKDKKEGEQANGQLYEALAKSEERERVLTEERDALLTELGTLRAKEPPLLQCIDCRNTESCAGAMARMFNHGRCLHCGGYFKVIRA